MRDNYRNELTAALNRTQALEDENAALRAKVESKDAVEPPEEPEKPAESEAAPKSSAPSASSVGKSAGTLGVIVSVIVLALKLMSLLSRCSSDSSHSPGFVVTHTGTSPTFAAKEESDPVSLPIHFGSVKGPDGPLVAIATTPSGIENAPLIGKKGVVHVAADNTGTYLKKSSHVDALAALSFVDNGTSVTLVVGRQGGIATRRGLEEFSVERSGTTFDLHAVSGTNEALYAVGEEGTVLSKRSSHGREGWNRETTSTTSTLYAVAATSKRAMAVGESGTVVVRNADGLWERLVVPTKETLRAVFLDGEGKAILAGNGGIILVEDGGGFQTMSLPSLENIVGISPYLQNLVVATREGNVWTLQPTGAIGKEHLTDAPLVGLALSNLRLLAVSQKGEVFEGTFPSPTKAE